MPTARRPRGCSCAVEECSVGHEGQCGASLEPHKQLCAACKAAHEKSNLVTEAAQKKRAREQGAAEQATLNAAAASAADELRKQRELCGALEETAAQESRLRLAAEEQQRQQQDTSQRKIDDAFTQGQRSLARNVFYQPGLVPLGDEGVQLAKLLTDVSVPKGVAVGLVNVGGVQEMYCPRMMGGVPYERDVAKLCTREITADEYESGFRSCYAAVELLHTTYSRRRTSTVRWNYVNEMLSTALVEYLDNWLGR